MDVLISGKAGLAALITGDEASLINYSGDVMKRSNYDVIARQFLSYDDTLFIESTNRDAAIRKLKYESDKSDALLILLTILDSNISDNSKDELIKMLDELLTREEILFYIRGVIYSRPLEDNSIKDVSDLDASGESHTIGLVKNLIASQEKIKAMYCSGTVKLAI